MNDAPPEVSAIYQMALHGDPEAIRDLLENRPELLKTFLEYYGTVGSRLDRRTYEIVYLRISALNGCTSCLQAHRESSRWVGLTPRHWQALESGDHSLFDSTEQAALRFAEKLTREPAMVEKADVAALRQCLTSVEAVDLHLLVELANLASRLPNPMAADLKGPKVRIQRN